MGDRQLLDCTLRDGGYMNDWEFGRNRMVSVFERLVDSGVDMIETGFLDDRRPPDFNRSISPDTGSMGRIWECVAKRPPMVVGMIDYGTCAIENIQPQDESFLDGIRVIFKKQKMHEAMAFCKELKELGYKVFSQLVSVTAYEDKDLSELLCLVNRVKPYAVSIVDTYGLLLPQQLLHYVDILDAGASEEIHLGFHAHNNFQMGFANVQAFFERETERNLFADGTLYGMGKSAGNAPLELLAMRMNDLYRKDYRIQPMLEAIEDSILPVYRKTPWGYQKFFYMASKGKCHPNYLSFFQEKGNLSQSALDELLNRIEPKEKKLLYDQKLAEELYKDYLEEKFDDAGNLKRLGSDMAGRGILLIGPGRNIKIQAERVRAYIDDRNPLKISVNYIPDDIETDYVFVTKGSRYEEMTLALHDSPQIRIIATSNLAPGNREFDYVVMREPLLEKKEQFADNSLLMLLKVLKRTGRKKLACAGFDGYSSVEDNYVVSSMEYDFVKGAAQFLNHHIQQVLSSEFADVQIEFVTYSHYCDAEDMDRAAY